MKAAIRAFLSAVVILAVIPSIDELCVLPWQCSTLEYRLEQSTRQLVDFPTRVDTAVQERANLDAAIRCIRIRPTRINLYMTAAVNCRLLGDNRRAVEFYKSALHYDKRPELYAALGNAQSQIGQRREAVENLVRANIFWPGNGDDIEDAVVRDEVLRRVAQYESALGIRP